MIKSINDLLLAIDMQQQKIGMSDYELARKTRIAKSTICKWKYGQHSPNLQGLLTVLDAVGLELTVKERIIEDEQIDILRA